MIDTLAYTKELTAVGFTPEQAEVQATALKNAVEKGTATKEDIANVKSEIAELKGEVKLNRWMIGFSIALNVAVFLKLFMG